MPMPKLEDVEQEIATLEAAHADAQKMIECPGTGVEAIALVDVLLRCERRLGELYKTRDAFQALRGAGRSA